MCWGNLEDAMGAGQASGGSKLMSNKQALGGDGDSNATITVGSTSELIDQGYNNKLPSINSGPAPGANTAPAPIGTFALRAINALGVGKLKHDESEANPALAAQASGFGPRTLPSIGGSTTSIGNWPDPLPRIGSGGSGKSGRG